MVDVVESSTIEMPLFRISLFLLSSSITSEPLNVACVRSEFLCVIYSLRCVASPTIRRVCCMHATRMCKANALRLANHIH